MSAEIIGLPLIMDVPMDDVATFARSARLLQALFDDIKRLLDSQPEGWDDGAFPVALRAQLLAKVNAYNRLVNAELPEPKGVA